MAFVTKLMRPAFCRMWRRPLLTVLLGLVAGSTPITLWATCDGYYWGSGCANGLSTCNQCEACVVTDCSIACSNATDTNNCIQQGDYTCFVHFRSGC